MSAIKGVLKEELGRLKILLTKYRQEARKCPRGSVSIKPRKGHNYAYLAYRKGAKICFEYLGNAQSKRVAAIKDKVRSRREYESRMRRINKEIRELERAVYGRTK